MPVYEYECGNCGGRFEIVQKFSDPALTVCKLCNATAIRKVLSPTAFVLKGSGWYATDYPSQDRKQASSSKKSSEDSKPATSCDSGACTRSSCPSKGSKP
ncbi:MAG: FmdB family zinc ribbon protein [Betaproteobacteria bacterium]